MQPRRPIVLVDRCPPLLPTLLGLPGQSFSYTGRTRLLMMHITWQGVGVH